MGQRDLEFLPEKMLRVLPGTNLADEATLEGGVAALKRRMILKVGDGGGGGSQTARHSRSYLHRLTVSLNCRPAPGGACYSISPAVNPNEEQMNRNQKIAIGCGGAGCLGRSFWLAVVSVVGFTHEWLVFVC